MSTNLIPVEPVEDRVVNLLVVYNALNLKDRDMAQLHYDRSKSLLDYMEGLPNPESWSVSINAEPYPVSEWALIYPQPGDYITAIPIPHGGGGGGKNVLRLVAMIAISIYAPQVGIAMAGKMGFAANSMMAYGLTAAVTVAGGMLVNAILPLPKPASGSSIGDSNESPTYGIDGAKNTQTEDVVVPLIYGAFRYAGNYVNVRTENRGREQIVYAQAVVSEGEVESITDFEIEDQPLSNYQDVSTVVRRGTSEQSIVGWFASAMEMKNKSVTLGTDWTTHTTVGVIDGFRVDAVFSNGLSKINSENGKRENRSVSFEIQYRRQGVASWTNLFNRQLRELTSSSIPANSDLFRAEYRQTFKGSGVRSVTGRLSVRTTGGSWVLMQTAKSNVSLHSGTGFLSGAFNVGLERFYDKGAMEYKIEWENASPTIMASARYPLSPKVTAKTAQPLRKSYESGVLTEGVYEIRIRRTTAESTSDTIIDRVILTDIGEIINERVRYNHTAFYGVKVRLSDQLNGLPKITALVKGIKVAHYDWSSKLVKRVWSENPAWITLDLLINARYGAGMPLSRIDMPLFVEWAEFCEKEKLAFNGVFDTMSNVWDVCQLVLRVGHARFVSVGNMISVSIYRKSEPVMMFGSGNILEGSLKLNWQSIEDRSNEFEIEFYDRQNRNRQNTVRVVNESAIARGEQQRISTIRMVGIDNQRQALHEAHFQKALNEALIMSGELEASIEAIACGVGDVVLLQHDMPDWGESGRIQPGSTRTVVKVDRPLTIPTMPSNSSMLVLHPAVQRGTGTIGIVTSNTKTVYLTGLSTSIKAKRMRVGQRDLQILGMSASGGYLEVVLESVSGLKVGDASELWDVNVIDTRKIHSYNADLDEVTLAGPLAVEPQDFANYMIGESGKAAKPVTITGIKGDADYKRTINFIEYNESLFDPVNVQETPLYTTPVREIGHVQDLRVDEELTLRSGSLTSNIIVAWNAPTKGDYAGARVFMSRNGGEMEFYGTTSAGATFFHVTGNMGETLSFKVVAFDGAGRTADFDSAPYWEYTILGASAPPHTVENFTVEKGMNGIEFAWSKSKELDVVGYEIREGNFWEGGETLVDGYAGNRFFTTKKIGGLYIYHIKAIDSLGNLSEQAATASLMLIAPSIVMGFSSVQNGDNAILEWRKNPEIEVIGYEIRQGQTWANSQHVAYVSGTSYTIPVGATSIDTYLIKAYDTAGVESLVAAKVNQAVYRSQSYNAVYQVNATEEGYQGAMMGFSRVGSRLEGEDAAQTEYAEYIQPLNMEKRYNAMVTTQELVAAKSTEVRTWADMRFPWSSGKAKAPWFPTANAEDITIEKEISLYTGRQEGDVAAWALQDMSGDAEYGSGTLTLANATTTTNGRFGHGVLINPASKLEVAFTEGNFVSWWIRPSMTMRDLCEIRGQIGAIRVRIEANELIMKSGTEISRKTFNMVVRDGDNYYVSVFSNAGVTQVYMRSLETGRDVVSELKVDIGALSGIRYV